METDLLAEKMRQGAEVLEKLAAMGVASVTVESIKEKPKASDAKPEGTEQDVQTSIESTITGTHITFRMPKPQEEKKETWQRNCTFLFVGAFVAFLGAIFLYLLFVRGCSTSPTPGSYSFRQSLSTTLETHEMRVPEKEE